MAKYVPKLAFLVILDQLFAFLAHLVPCPTKKNNANEVPRWFSDVWVPELLFLPKIIKMLDPKKALFAPKYAFLPAHMVPCWLVGWGLWRAGFILQDTYLLYQFQHPDNRKI